jgi:hypothetical protein
MKFITQWVEKRLEKKLARQAYLNARKEEFEAEKREAEKARELYEKEYPNHPMPRIGFSGVGGIMGVQGYMGTQSTPRTTQAINQFIAKMKSIEAGYDQGAQMEAEMMEHRKKLRRGNKTVFDKEMEEWVELTNMSDFEGW